MFLFWNCEFFLNLCNFNFYCFKRIFYLITFNRKHLGFFKIFGTTLSQEKKKYDYFPFYFAYFFQVFDINSLCWTTICFSFCLFILPHMFFPKRFWNFFSFWINIVPKKSFIRFKLQKMEVNLFLTKNTCFWNSNFCKNLQKICISRE